MLIPTVEYCLVCEDVRPEPFGKMSILGFYGQTPSVNIKIKDVGGTIKILFVLGMKAKEAGKYEFTAALYDPNKQELGQVGVVVEITSPVQQQVLAVGFVLPVQVLGTYAFKLHMGSKRAYQTTLQIMHAAPADFNLN